MPRHEPGARRRETFTITVTRAQERFFSWTRDILVYTVILNLFVEYWDTIVIDSFTISLFTAAVLKVMLDLLTGVEHRLGEFVGRYSTVLRYLSVWLVLFISKFVILEVIDIIFGEHVELGSFIEVVALVLALMVGREALRRIYLALGNRSARDAEAAA
jgi:hypothetical protein